MNYTHCSLLRSTENTYSWDSKGTKSGCVCGWCPVDFTFFLNNREVVKTVNGKKMTGVGHRTTKEILRLPFPSQSRDKPWLWPNKKKRTDQTLKSGNSSKAIKLCIEAIMHNYQKKKKIYLYIVLPNHTPEINHSAAHRALGGNIQLVLNSSLVANNIENEYNTTKIISIYQCFKNYLGKTTSTPMCLTHTVQNELLRS